MTSIDYRSATTLDQERKYKPHVKELERENRFLELKKDKIENFERMKREWEHKEKELEESRIRNKQKIVRRKLELKNLIEKDLCYDPHEDKYHPSCEYFSKSSKGNLNSNLFIDKLRERRKIEAKKDEEDRLREIEEIKIEKERKKQEEIKRQEEIRKEEERKNRAKSRFTEIVPVPKASEEKPSDDMKVEPSANVPQPPPPIPSVNNNPQAYFTPQNVPEGTFPLRVLEQSNVNMLRNPKGEVNFPPPPPPIQGTVQQPVFNPPPPPPQYNQSELLVSAPPLPKIAATFKQATQEAAEEESDPKKIKNISLTETLKELDQRKQEIEAREKEMK